jgi:hypothetical protein
MIDVESSLAASEVRSTLHVICTEECDADSMRSEVVSAPRANSAERSRSASLVLVTEVTSVRRMGSNSLIAPVTLVRRVSAALASAFWYNVNVVATSKAMAWARTFPPRATALPEGGSCGRARRERL